MSKKTQSPKLLAALMLIGAGYALPAAALTCPAGEKASADGKSCAAWEAPKAQLDTSKYEGSLKSEAEACNKLNQAKVDSSESTKEIGRINADLDAHFVERKKAKDADAKAKIGAEIDKLKADRKAQETKLAAAKKEMNAGKKELRAATKAVKKDKKESLNCA